MTLAATYYGANGWLLEFDDLCVPVSYTHLTLPTKKRV